MADINLGVGGANSAVAGGYEIANSLKLESDNTEYLSRTPSSAGNRRTWTLSCWVKRTEITADSNSVGNQHMILSAGNTYIQFDGNAIWVNLRAASENFFLATNRLFRDTSAWYHVVLQCDTTQGTASNRAKLWVNGVQETSFQNSTYDNMPLNYETLMNNTNEHEVGKYSNEETTYANFFSGYMAEMHLVDGTALAPTDFGEFDDDSGIWKPKAYTGSYGTNGFYLDFESSGSLGADSSGNGHTWTLNNITAADQATDTPTNNFCTMAGLWEYSGGNRVGVDGGTTTNATNGGYAWQGGKGTMGVTNGKWYFEFTVDGGPSGFHSSFMVGWQTENMVGATASAHNIIGTIAYYGEGGGFIWVKDNTSGRTLSVTGSTTYGDIYGVALDLDSNPQTVIFYRNGSAITSNITLGSGLANETLFPFESTYYPQEISRWNFGGYTAMSIASGNTDENGYGNFEYAPPSGYYALCTKNLAEFG